MDEYEIIENLTHSDFTLIHPFRLLIVGHTALVRQPGQKILF